MKRTMVIKSAAVLGVVSLGLAACGGSTTSTESSAAPAAPAASAPAPASAAPAPSEAPASEPAAAACKNPTLITATLLPQTGSLAFLGPPEFAGVKMAVDEINAAGGVLGSPMTNIDGDSGDTSTDIATQTTDAALAKGAQVIIGAASSGVSLTVIDKITSNGVLMISPANTSPALTTYEDNGLYWRVAPSDALQGAILASTAIDSGITKAAVVARQDAYGEGLELAFAKNFTEAGGTITSQLLYDPEAATFDAEVAEIKAGAPEAVVVIGFEESVKLLQEMIKQGVGPGDQQVYLVDGNISTEAYKAFPKNTMKGVIATVPSGEADLTAFNEALLMVDPALTDYTYGAQAYDATMVAALAANVAGCADGISIAGALASVTMTGGEKCTTYADCLALIQAGTAIDFDGTTGPLDFNQYGDPASGTISINQYTSNGAFEEIGKVTAEVPLP